MNSLRGVAMDMKIPTCMLVGQYARDVTRTVEDGQWSGVALIEPALRAMGVGFYRLDHEDDVPLLAKAFEESRRDRKPVVVLIGAPTA
jgi:sulfopyruvate decarboxylase TPP-binding subunit